MKNKNLFLKKVVVVSMACLVSFSLFAQEDEKTFIDTHGQTPQIVTASNLWPDNHGETSDTVVTTGDYGDNHGGTPPVPLVRPDNHGSTPPAPMVWADNHGGF